MSKLNIPWTSKRKSWYDYVEMEGWEWRLPVYEAHQLLIKLDLESYKLHKLNVKKDLSKFQIQKNLDRLMIKLNIIKEFGSVYNMNYFKKFKRFPKPHKSNKLSSKERWYQYRLNYLNTLRKKYGIFFNLSGKDYKFARRLWGITIKQRDSKQCVVCHERAVHAHHIFYASFYPQLSLNLNNGLSLCLKHHQEVHLFDWFTPK